jgi:SAM-dependent methyltransferase
LATYLSPGPTLVVGASPLGLEVAARGPDGGDAVLVVERDPRRLEEIPRFARQLEVDVRLVPRDVEREPLGIPARSVTNVVCLDALERFRDDVGVLEKLHAILEPDGRLVVRVAAHPWASRVCRSAPNSVRRFDAEALRDALEEAGFRTVSLRHWNFLGVPGTFLQDRVLRRESGREQPKHWWDRGIDLWFRAVENRVGFPIGVSLIAVATPYLEKAALSAPERKRMFTPRTAREAYEPMAAGR